MYTYYFLASAIGKNEKARKRYLWWGKYLTQLQITQFVTMLMQVCPTPSPLPFPLSTSVVQQ
jgi:elongation of very long chain fatty acids protein 4